VIDMQAPPHPTWAYITPSQWNAVFEPFIARIAELEEELAHQKLLTEDSENHAAFETELNRKSLARAEQAEAERDALEELVEDLDPHHLRRNKMGMRRLL